MSYHKNLLQNVYLFRGMPHDGLELINSICTVETVASGADIFSQGDQALALYVVKYGSVRIAYKSSGGDNLEVSVLGTGSHFGEMPFVDGERRSATATAMEKTEIVIVPYDKLREILDRNPNIAVYFYRELAHFLCGRLRITTQDLTFAREKNLSHF